MGYGAICLLNISNFILLIHFFLHPNATSSGPDCRGPGALGTYRVGLPPETGGGTKKIKKKL